MLLIIASGPLQSGDPMFSSRFHWDFRPNRLSQLLAEKRRAGAPHPRPHGVQSHPRRAGLSARDRRRLSTIRGCSPTIRRRAGRSKRGRRWRDYYAARGHAVDPDRILLTASTSEAYAYLFKLLANPGDHILVPRPSYPLFEFLANMESVDVRQYRLSYHGEWAIDLDALEISERTRAIVLVNPNNPTGSYLKRARTGGPACCRCPAHLG